jgi:hypothetical protein
MARADRAAQRGGQPARWRPCPASPTSEAESGTIRPVESRAFVPLLQPAPSIVAAWRSSSCANICRKIPLSCHISGADPWRRRIVAQWRKVAQCQRSIRQSRS